MRSRKAKRVVPGFLHPSSHCNCFPFVLPICTERHLPRHFADIFLQEQKTKLHQVWGSQAREPTVMTVSSEGSGRAKGRLSEGGDAHEQ